MFMAYYGPRRYDSAVMCPPARWSAVRRGNPFGRGFEIQSALGVTEHAR
jgi:hypothetical protein